MAAFAVGIGTGAIAASLLSKLASDSRLGKRVPARIPSIRGWLGTCAPWLSLSGRTTAGADNLDKLVNFLLTVPLFQVALPCDQIPRVAAVLVRKEWSSGTEPIQAGQPVPGFCVIMEGEARVIVTDPEGNESESVTLRRGDYWGERALHRRFLSDYSLIVTGAQPLVAFMLTRRSLSSLGLQGKLRLPNRPAMLEGKWRNARLSPQGSAPVHCVTDGARYATTAEVSWVVERMRECPQLRALLSMQDEAVREVASKAVKRQVAAGTVLATAGDPGRDAFIVASGTFEVVPGALNRARRRKSAEAVVACQRLAQRNLLNGEVLEKLASSGRFPPTRGGQKYFACKSAAELMSSRAHERCVMKRRSDCSQIQPKVLELLGIRPKGGITDFDVGSEVVCMEGLGLPDDVGVVLRMPEQAAGGVLVDFPTAGGPREVPSEHLASAAQEVNAIELEEGCVFGELTALYDSPYLATLMAKTSGEVYVISGCELKSLRGNSARVEERARLLDEVKVLAPLLQVERLELARVSSGTLAFQPGEDMLRQGASIPEPMWYIVMEGSCIAHDSSPPTGDRQVIAEFSRAQHFGEWSILHGASTMSYGVTAGPRGATVLVISGDIVRRLRIFSLTISQGAREDALGVLPRLDTDAATYMRCACKTLSGTRHCGSDVPMSSLSPVALLGRGAFGDAYLVESGGGKQYALKRLSLKHVRESDAMGRTKFERDLMSLVDCNFVVHFIKALMDDTYIYFLMEAATGGHLADLISERPEVFEDCRPHGSAACFYAACVVAGCAYLHERHIAHRDVKLENIVIDPKGYAKLCDLGFARFLLGKSRTILGTPQYMAPELIEPPHEHDASVDWWALGVVVFELLVHHCPWDADGAEFESPWAQLVAVQDGHARGVPWKKICASMPCARDIVRKLLTDAVQHRLGARGAEDVKAHAWFAGHGIEFSALEAGSIPSPFQPPPIDEDPEILDELADFVKHQGAASDRLMVPF